MKKYLAFFIALSALLGVSADEKPVRAGILNGPSAVPVAFMMDRNSANGIEFSKFSEPQALLPKMLRDEIDVGFFPVNVAAKVYNTTAGAIVCAAVTGNGNLVLLTKDRSVSGLGQLSGKTVSVAGQGATPEYMFKKLLSENNVYGVTLDFSVPTAGIAAALISDKVKYAVLPEPFASVAELKSKDVFRAVDFQAEYARIAGSGGNFPLTLLVARRGFVEESPERMNLFMEELRDSIERTVKNPVEAGRLNEKYGLGLKASAVSFSVPKSNFVFIPADEARTQIETLISIFLDYDGASVGGKLPDDGFYWRAD